MGIVAAIGTAKVAGLIDAMRNASDARLPKAAGFALMTIADRGLDANSSARALPALALASSATVSISRID